MTDVPKVIQSDASDTRTFSYRVDKVSLSFTLRTDIKQELKDFRMLLEAALLDVDKEINKK